ncbi:MAG: molybdenum cofactor biosynthesis protein B [Frankiaceae bacterium]
MSDLPAGATARVITVSDRAFAGDYADRSGPLAVELLAAAGLQVAEAAVVPDSVPEIVAALHAAIEDDIDLVVTTGGTGLAPRDVTPEATLRVVEREVPGIVEAMRAEARDQVPTAMLSRAVAGIVHHTLVVNLPGSTGGVRDGVAVLCRVLGHALAQARGGGDHGRGEPATGS